MLLEPNATVTLDDELRRINWAAMAGKPFKLRWQRLERVQFYKLALKDQQRLQEIRTRVLAIHFGICRH